ncbi:MAG: polysaccharide deacetylase, partial [Planctomycetota bacterium]|nr:polysaccharide deacetylase [Planctomycetota bacterium]
KPFTWACGEGHLTEIPVTTMPFFKVPIHASYILYLAQYSRTTALTYCRMALALCRAAGVGPSLLLHPLDFMGCNDDRDLAFFPAMDRPAEPKIEIVAQMIDMMSQHYHVVPMKDHAAAIKGKLSVTSVMDTIKVPVPNQ